MLATTVAFTASYYIARFADQGLADFAGLHTYRHGTNIISWIGIHILGGKPEYAGRPWGSDEMTPEDMGHEADSFYLQGDIPSNSWISFQSALDERRVPKLCAFRSTIHGLLGRRIAKKMDDHATKHRAFGAIFIGLLQLPILAVSQMVPNIKFRMTDKQKKSLVENIYQPQSVYTDEKQSPLRIGLIGTLWASCSRNLPRQMWKNPDKVVKGVAMLALTGLAAYAGVTYYAPLIATHRVAIIAGSLLAVV